MNDVITSPTSDTSGNCQNVRSLDENVWRAWQEKNRLRDIRMRKRMLEAAVGIFAAVAIGAAILSRWPSL